MTGLIIERDDTYKTLFYRARAGHSVAIGVDAEHTEKAMRMYFARLAMRTNRMVDISAGSIHNHKKPDKSCRAILLFFIK